MTHPTCRLGSCSTSSWLKEELFGGWNKFEAFWLLLFIAIQVAVFYFVPDSAIGVITGIAGIVCVVFVGKGKISNYFFGLIFSLGYTYITYQNQLYGEMMLALAVYLPAQFIGYFKWNQNLSAEQHTVVAKTLSLPQWLLVIAIAAIGTLAYVQLLTYLGSALPYLDGVNVVVIVLAQLLMVLRYREQWALWIVVNVLQIWLWAQLYISTGATDWAILVMTVVYLLNSLYGYYNWTKLAKQ